MIWLRLSLLCPRTPTWYSFLLIQEYIQFIKDHGSTLSFVTDVSVNPFYQSFYFHCLNSCLDIQILEDSLSVLLLFSCCIQSFGDLHADSPIWHEWTFSIPRTIHIHFFQYSTLISTKEEKNNYS